MPNARLIMYIMVHVWDAGKVCGKESFVGYVQGVSVSVSIFEGRLNRANYGGLSFILFYCFGY